MKKGQNFAKSKLGKVVADLSKGTQSRPSDLLGIEGSPLEKLLWDIAMTVEHPAPVVDWSQFKVPKSVKEKVLAKRERMGIPRYTV